MTSPSPFLGNRKSLLKSPPSERFYHALFDSDIDEYTSGSNTQGTFEAQFNDHVRGFK